MTHYSSVQRDLMRIRVYFYVKCGSITRIFTYVFMHIETYNLYVFIAVKRTNSYVLAAKKT